MSSLSLWTIVIDWYRKGSWILSVEIYHNKDLDHSIPLSNPLPFPFFISTTIVPFYYEPTQPKLVLTRLVGTK